MTTNPWIPTALAAALAAACGTAGDEGAEGESEAESEAAAVCPETPGTACVWAGLTGELGLGDDGLDRRETMFYWTMGMKFAPDGTMWFMDWNNHRVRRVRPDDTVETLVGEFVGDGPRDQSDLVEPGAPGGTVQLNHPTDLAFRDDGLVLLSAWHNHKIRRIDPSQSPVLVYVLHGRGPGWSPDGPAGSSARFNQPQSIEVGPDGALYILDQRNFVIRRIAGAGDGDTIETVAGTQGQPGFSGDGGPPLAAQFRFDAGGNPQPSGALTFGPDGRLYVADSLNHRIRAIDFQADTVETVAGTGEAGHAGDGGPALDASLNNPRDLEFGPDGRLYVADTENHAIRAIDLSSGTLDRVAGTGQPGSDCDGVPAAECGLNRPFDIEPGPDGALYVADTFNSRIIRIQP